tara:strand:+ start:900 stop:1034 length:135 start_codon:yes stop_codon:yes gene_type:complete
MYIRFENWKPDKKEIKFLNVGTGNDMQIKKLLKLLLKNVDLMVK